MSQRIGMADGRCLTVNMANRLYIDKMQKDAGIAQEDNYSFRRLIQTKGPEGIPLPANPTCLKPFTLNPRDG
jgi:hypothetical protein